MDTELVLVGGIDRDGVAAALVRLLSQPGTAVLGHDLSEVSAGRVHRRLRTAPPAEAEREPLASDVSVALPLAHGCLWCTLREDVLPLIRVLARRPDIRRVVLHLDPLLEPERVCRSVLYPLLDAAGHNVRLAGVITVIDPVHWLDDALGDEDLIGRGFAAPPDDERTLAQLVVAQAEFADLIVYTGRQRDPDARWRLGRANAVLSRLAPLAPRVSLSQLRPADPLAGLPAAARRGRPESPHAPLLRGQPDLDEDLGVRMLLFSDPRPFHPTRLHDAIDVLLDGVVRCKGRLWLASRPEATLWLETAGGGAELGQVDQWLAAGDRDAWAGADPEHQAAAALRWHPRFGDRAQELAILTCDANAEEIGRGLRAALLTDAELDAGEKAWARYPDPFDFQRAETCVATDPTPNR